MTIRLAISIAALCIALSSCQSYQPPGAGLDPVVKQVLSNP